MIFLITGGASGLGEAITRKIAADPNYTVYFTYCSSKTSAKKIEAEFSNAFAIKCDFDDEFEVKKLIDIIKGLDIDVLINNAYFGTFIKSYFHKTSSDNFLSEFKKNVIPTITITQSVLSCFRKKKQGKIITILTSALLNTPPIGSSIYVANKAYIEELTKVWATENAKFNITSNCISPSLMLTNFTKDIDERIIEQIKEENPQKKLLTTEEVADSVLFLVKATQQINGINIVINSGTDIL